MLRSRLGDFAGAEQIDRGDPRAGMVSRLTGWELLRVQTGISLFFVLLFEFVVTFGMFIALDHGAWRRVRPSATSSAPKADAPTTEPAMAGLGAPRLAEAGTSAKRRKGVALIEGSKTNGDVAKFAVACLEPAAGKETAIPDLFTSYKNWCEREGLAAVEAGQFAKLFAGLCQLAGFRCVARGERMYCVDLKLAA